MPTIDKTNILVKAALSGQKDKAGVSKYLHCIRVWHNVLDLLKEYRITDSDTVKRVQLVALLHDAIEDSDLTDHDLHVFGYSNSVIDAVLLVTHDESGSYHDYIDELCRSGNILALLAKLADNLDNTSEDRTKHLDDRFKAYLEARYAGVQAKLRAAIEAWIEQKKWESE